MSVTTTVSVGLNVATSPYCRNLRVRPEQDRAHTDDSTPRAAVASRAMNLPIAACAILTSTRPRWRPGAGTTPRAVPAGADGKVVFRDALDDNRNGWFDHPAAPFRNGRWEWNDIPEGGPEFGPDALFGKEPDAVSVSVERDDARGQRLPRGRAAATSPPRTHSCRATSSASTAAAR